MLTSWKDTLLQQCLPILQKSQISIRSENKVTALLVRADVCRHLRRPKSIPELLFRNIQRVPIKCKLDDRSRRTPDWLRLGGELDHQELLGLEMGRKRLRNHRQRFQLWDQPLQRLFQICRKWDFVLFDYDEIKKQLGMGWMDFWATAKRCNRVQIWGGVYHRQQYGTN